MVNWPERSMNSPEKNRLNLWISDYTKWQRDLWPDESVEALSKKAMEAIQMNNGEPGA